MIEINLLPKEERKERTKVPIVGTVMILAFVGIGVVLGMMYLANLQKISSLTNEKADLEQKINKPEFKTLDATAKTLEAQLKDIKNKVAVLDRLQKGRTFTPQLLETLLLKIPEDMWLESMSLRGNTLSLSGKSKNNFIISDFAESLEVPGFIDKATIESVSETKVNSGKDEKTVASFSITCVINSAFRDGKK